MLVTCSISFFERLLFALRKPASRISLPRGLPAISRAFASKAMAPSSACTLRLPPASSCSDSCASLNSSAARPAGVWRSAPRSSSRPLSSSRFSANIRAALHHRFRLLLLHHRRRGGDGLVHLDDQVAQHRVRELERVLELREGLVVALDVHEDVVRLVHLGEGIRELPAAPVFQAMHRALAACDEALVDRKSVVEG